MKDNSTNPSSQEYINPELAAFLRSNVFCPKCGRWLNCCDCQKPETK